MSQDALYGVATDRVPVPWVLPCPDPRAGSVLAGRVDALCVLGRDRSMVGVVRVGRGYIASVGRVRVAGACPLGALALACEWAGVLGVRA